MPEHDPSAYGESVAGEYDSLYGELPETDEAVATLAGLAGPGPVLELGIGTGRLALPLLRRGLEVSGIEGSEAMVAELRRKPGGERIPVEVGDFAETRIEGSFALVVLALNTVFALPSQDAQVRCFQNAARHLSPGGAFALEAFVLDLSSFRAGQAVEPRFVSPERAELQIARYDALEQRLERTLVHLGGPGGVRLVQVRDRYASPGELDLMARVAGLRLRERWGGWRREPFSAASTKHVSIYEGAP